MSGLRFPKPTRRKKATKRTADTPESILQGFAEGLLKAMSIPYLRLSDSLMRTLFASPQIPIWIKRNLSKELKGWADIIAFRQVSDKYCLTLFLELKTDIGKLRPSQKKRNAELGYVYQVARSEQEIEQVIKVFMDYEVGA